MHKQTLTFYRNKKSGRSLKLGVISGQSSAREANEFRARTKNFPGWTMSRSVPGTPRSAPFVAEKIQMQSL
jgi:hypothetical protein